MGEFLAALNIQMYLAIGLAILITSIALIHDELAWKKYKEECEECKKHEEWEAKQREERRLLEELLEESIRNENPECTTCLEENEDTWWCPHCHRGTCQECLCRWSCANPGEVPMCATCRAPRPVTQMEKRIGLIYSRLPGTRSIPFETTYRFALGFTGDD